MSSKIQVLKNFNRSQVKDFFNSFDTVLTDCDGVLWKGPKALPNSAETISTLQKLGKKVIFVTNNATKTRDEYLAKCSSLGFEAKDVSFVTYNYYISLLIILFHRMKYFARHTWLPNT